MYTILRTKSFEKDLKRVLKHKDFSPHKLADVIDLLTEGTKLDPKYKNHILRGNMSNVYDLHVQNDFVLLYEKDEEIRLIALIRLGSHSDLF